MKGNCGYLFNVSEHKVNFDIFKNNLLVSKMIKKNPEQHLAFEMEPILLASFL